MGIGIRLVMNMRAELLFLGDLTSSLKYGTWYNVARYPTLATPGQLHVLYLQVLEQQIPAPEPCRRRRICGGQTSVCLILPH